MTAIENAIRDAMENGWENQYFSSDYDTRDIWQIFVCQPAFWQALGKARGWNEVQEIEERRETHSRFTRKNWLYQWHRFIDALAEGKSAEQFFQELDGGTAL